MTPRRALLALAVAGAPLLQLAGMVPHPVLPDDAAGLHAALVADPEVWLRIHLLAGASALAFLIAAVALASLVRHRGAALATGGALLMVLGCAALAVAFVTEAQWASVADPGLDRAAMIALLEVEGSSFAMSLLPVGFPLVGLGTILLMSGLLRSGAVPRWQPALVLLGSIASIAAAPGSDLGPLLLSPAAVGYLALAVQVLRGPQLRPAPALPVTDRALQPA